MDDPIKTKICYKCRDRGPQPLTAFNKNATKEDGYQDECRACTRAYLKTYGHPSGEVDESVTHKICTKCPEKGLQPVANFHKNCRRKDGYASQCIVCARADNALHIARVRKNRKDYYAAHTQQELASNKQWRIDNPDTYLTAIARWQAEHPVQHKAIKRKASRAYTARKNQAPQIEEIDEDAIYKRDRGICQLCHQRVDLKYQSPHPRSKSLDHVIPLSEGGPHTMQNLVLVHRGCNSRKGNRHNSPQQQRLFG